MVSRREVVGGTLLLAGLGAAHAENEATAGVRTRFAFEAHVLVAAPLVIGTATWGLRRVIPITGGTVKGPRLNGRVLAGGADWQVVRPDGVLDVEAKYTLEAEDGTQIMVTNKGMRHGPKDVIDRLTRGEVVDPSSYYFRTSAQFEVAATSPHAWLNRAIFIGVGERTATAAIIRFHEVL
jgi:hypothetical protein